MKTLVFAFMACIILLSCKTKQSGPEKKYVSIASIIRGQVAGVDTSLYSIKRLDIIDSSRTDTAFIHREQFRGLAKDFLELPDIADKDNRDGFREETRFDDMMNTVVITYLPTNPSNSHGPLQFPRWYSRQTLNFDLAILPGVRFSEQLRNWIVCLMNSSNSLTFFTEV